MTDVERAKAAIPEMVTLLTFASMPLAKAVADGFAHDATGEQKEMGGRAFMPLKNLMAIVGSLKALLADDSVWDLINAVGVSEHGILKAADVEGDLFRSSGSHGEHSEKEAA